MKNLIVGAFVALSFLNISSCSSTTNNKIQTIDRNKFCTNHYTVTYTTTPNVTNSYILSYSESNDNTLIDILYFAKKDKALAALDYVCNNTTPIHWEVDKNNEVELFMVEFTDQSTTPVFNLRWKPFLLELKQAFQAKLGGLYYE
jgi:hypothetical protein